MMVTSFKGMTVSVMAFRLGDSGGAETGGDFGAPKLFIYTILLL